MSKEFMISRDDQQYGPYSTEDLLQYLKDGKVGLDDFVWSEGMDEWKPLNEIAGELNKNDSKNKPIEHSNALQRKNHIKAKIIAPIIAVIVVIFFLKLFDSNSPNSSGKVLAQVGDAVIYKGNIDQGLPNGLEFKGYPISGNGEEYDISIKNNWLIVSTRSETNEGGISHFSTPNLKCIGFQKYDAIGANLGYAPPPGEKPEISRMLCQSLDDQSLNTITWNSNNPVPISLRKGEIVYWEISNTNDNAPLIIKLNLIKK